jgi:hypothetical protein
MNITVTIGDDSFSAKGTAEEITGLFEIWLRACGVPADDVMARFAAIENRTDVLEEQGERHMATMDEFRAKFAAANVALVEVKADIADLKARQAKGDLNAEEEAELAQAVEALTAGIVDAAGQHTPDAPAPTPEG